MRDIEGCWKSNDRSGARLLTLRPKKLAERSEPDVLGAFAHVLQLGDLLVGALRRAFGARLGRPRVRHSRVGVGGSAGGAEEC